MRDRIRPNSAGSGQRAYLGDDGSEIDSPPNAEYAIDDDGAIRVPERPLDLLDRGHSEVVRHEPAEGTVPGSLSLRQAQLLDHCHDRQDRGQHLQGLHAFGTSAVRVGSGSWLFHNPMLVQGYLAQNPTTSARHELSST